MGLEDDFVFLRSITVGGIDDVMYAPKFVCPVYGCTNPYPGGQCPFCAFWFCNSHVPGICGRCRFQVCAVCFQQQRCCQWAQTQWLAKKTFSSTNTNTNSNIKTGIKISTKSSSIQISSSYLSTNDIEAGIKKDVWPTFLKYKEGDAFAFWKSKNFLPINIKFLIVSSGVCLEVHLKWGSARSWYQDDPYAMSLKKNPTKSVTARCFDSLANVMADDHRYLWGHLLHRGRKLIAAYRVVQLLKEFKPKKHKVTTTMIKALISAGRTEDLIALFIADMVPLKDWAQEAWSLFLDWYAR